MTAARSILFAFALWGSAQLIYALIQWLAIFRCKSLVPLMWAVQILETLLRILVGHLKPDTFAHTPHGRNWELHPSTAGCLDADVVTLSRDRAVRKRRWG